MALIGLLTTICNNFLTFTFQNKSNYIHTHLVKLKEMISITVPDEIREKMKKYPQINWSEIARSAILKRIELEEQLTNVKIDMNLLKKAIKTQDLIRNKPHIQKSWSSTEEIRKWRETRK